MIVRIKFVYDVNSAFFGKSYWMAQDTIQTQILF